MQPFSTCTLRFRSMAILLFCLLASSLSAAPTPEEARRHQALLDLTNDYIVMCVAAHPDDEDGQTLTYLRKKLGVETIVVVASRGEGGQNEIGPELYKDLGVIRTHEMDAASRINGAKYFNLNNIDFGFSKSADETFEFWDRNTSVRNMVELIRWHKPDIIITHHDTVSGHGHHQATGRMIIQACDLAADTNYEVMSTQFVADGPIPAWQVKRLYVRTRDSEGIATPVGEYDAFWQEQYADIAQRGLAQHRSQGMDKGRRDGFPADQVTRYAVIKSAPGVPQPVHSLLDGIPNDSPFANKNLISLPDKDLRYILRDFTPLQTAARRSRHNALLVQRWMMVAQAAVWKAGLTVSASQDTVTPGETMTVSVTVDAGEMQSPFIEVGIGENTLQGIPQGWKIDGHRTKELHGGGTTQFIVRAPDMLQQDYTIPHTEYFYRFLSNLPPPGFSVNALFYDKQPRISNKIDTTQAVIRANLSVDFVPSLELLLPEPILMASMTGKPVPFTVDIANNGPDKQHVKLDAELPPGWSIPGEPEVVDLKPRSRQTLSVQLQHPKDLPIGDHEIVLAIGTLARERRKLTVRKIDVAVAPGLHVGIVKSYDNTLEQTLEQLGVSYTLLEEPDLASGDLSRFDTIVLDIRAYLVRQDLVRHNKRMLEYVHNGGHVICMYNKTFEWNQPVGVDNYAPYPIRLGRDRVTRETAPVRILLPGHPLFRYPNAITDADWDGWVQERGLYFPDTAADAYVRLLSSQDPTESPLRDGHLIAQYGKGTYLYTSYVWYRQMKVLVPGGIRNFANMLSLPKAAAAGFAMP